MEDSSSRDGPSPSAEAAAGLSFSELLEQVSKAHHTQLQAAQKENLQLRCRLAFSQEKSRYGSEEKALNDTIAEEDAGDRGRFSPRIPVFREEYQEEDEPKFQPDSVWTCSPRAEPLVRTRRPQILSPVASPRGPLVPPTGDMPAEARETRGTSLGSTSMSVASAGCRDDDTSGTASAAPKEYGTNSRNPASPSQAVRSSPLSATSNNSARNSLTTPRVVSEALSRLTQHSHKEAHLPFSKKQSVGGPRSKRQLAMEVVKGAYFESTVWVLIAASTVIMAFEIQYQGIDLGYDLGYPGSHNQAARAWPGASNAFYVLEWVFGLLFTVELVVKLLALRGQFVCGKDSGWNLLDLVIVVAWWVSQADQFATATTFPVKLNPQLLRIFRLGRLLRLLKLVRRFSTFDSLHVMTTALKGSAHVFGWACLLLLLFQTMLALILTGTIQEMYLESASSDIEKRREVYEYFGTFTRSFLSMFELTLANWPPVARILTENISEWWTVFAILHKLTIGFALVGIINGVFMQETFKVASMDDKIMLRQKQAAKDIHARKMQALFAHLDTSHDGKLDSIEFRQIVRDKQVRDWLSAQDLTVNDADSLFEMIAGGDGEITADELIAGVARLKGNAMMLDLMVLTQQLLEFRTIFRAIAGFEPDEQPTRSTPLMEAVRSRRNLPTVASGRSNLPSAHSARSV